MELFLKKDIRNYYLKPPNISWGGIIFPLSWSLMQLIRSPDGNILELLPGLISMSVLFGTTSMLAVTITFERSGRSFERLLLAPISLNLMVLAKIAGTILFGIFNAFVPVIFASFYRFECNKLGTAFARSFADCHNVVINWTINCGIG